MQANSVHFLAGDQMRAEALYNPQQSLSIYRQPYWAQREPAEMFFPRLGFYPPSEQLNLESQNYGWRPEACQSGDTPPPTPPPTSPLLPSLSGDDMNRAAKVSGDLRRGDHGAMEGAVYQLQGMVKDNPALAEALIQQIQSESYGAPAQIIQNGQRVELVNSVTGERMEVGRLGGCNAVVPEASQVPAQHGAILFDNNFWRGAQY
jgi:hypothetical protein